MEVSYMSHVCLYRAQLTAGIICFALQFLHLPADASQIRYSWSGMLVPNASDDPWQIGDQGMPFELNIAVSQQAPDLHELNVELAAFAVDDALLLLNGEAVTFLGNGTLDFTDDLDGLFDVVVFVGIFERYGHLVEIGTSLALPVNTYDFTKLVERLPFFEASATVSQSAMGPQGPYTGIVAVGTPVVVVPEPSSVVVIATSSLLLITVGLWLADCRVSRVLRV